MRCVRTSADVDSALSLGVGNIFPRISSSSDVTSSSSVSAAIYPIDQRIVESNVLAISTWRRSSNRSINSSKSSLFLFKSPWTSDLRPGALILRASCSSFVSAVRAYSRFLKIQSISMISHRMALASRTASTLDRSNSLVRSFRSRSASAWRTVRCNLSSSWPSSAQAMSRALLCIRGV